MGEGWVWGASSTCDTWAVFAALVGYEIFVVLFAVVMLLALVGVSVIGVVKYAYQRRAARRAGRSSSAARR